MLCDIDLVSVGDQRQAAESTSVDRYQIQTEDPHSLLKIPCCLCSDVSRALGGKFTDVKEPQSRDGSKGVFLTLPSGTRERMQRY